MRITLYAGFEAKQTINAQYVKYAAEKLKTVRDLHRTSLPIPHAGGTYAAKPPIKIIGGILTFESDWTPGIGEALKNSLKKELNVLDIGCIAAHGYFNLIPDNDDYDFV
ncbi:hypothetical protein [Mucilaginibacter sp. UR6-1]|uniref:hypothetical protein n=1 Tax=Mucilaginibacter sp. UR6-1 TaxID=1435643 RepID=UPI00272A2E80|nr:hypothetical protein [Mucilaginibacter sp. UR6-1]